MAASSEVLIYALCLINVAVLLYFILLLVYPRAKGKVTHNKIEKVKRVIEIEDERLKKKQKCKVINLGNENESKNTG